MTKNICFLSQHRQPPYPSFLDFLTALLPHQLGFTKHTSQNIVIFPPFPLTIVFLSCTKRAQQTKVISIFLKIIPLVPPKSAVVVVQLPAGVPDYLQNINHTIFYHFRQPINSPLLQSCIIQKSNQHIYPKSIYYTSPFLQGTPVGSSLSLVLLSTKPKMKH